jgi:hypothetical protein
VLLKCCCVRCCCPRAASCSCTTAGVKSVLRRAAGKNMDFFRAGYPALTPYFSAFCEIAPLQVVTQTCFCCVLEMQHVESGAVLQHCRRDELAAEMLKVLTKPFMVRSAHVLHHTLLQFTCFCISNLVVVSVSPLLPPSMSRSLQAGLDDQNHSAKTCARMLKGCFRLSFPCCNGVPFLCSQA